MFTILNNYKLLTDNFNKYYYMSDDIHLLKQNYNELIKSL
jgi:hypothetical protein